jgi:hypothetical protein
MKAIKNAPFYIVPGISIGPGNCQKVLRISLKVYLIICSRYDPSFWTTNLEFENKQAIFDQT